MVTSYLTPISTRLSFLNVIRTLPAPLPLFKHHRTCVSVKMGTQGGIVNKFLRRIQTLLADETSGPISVSLGNEACDLDSVVSAVAMAYAATACGTPTIPVLNVGRGELGLRRDVGVVLEDVEVDTKLLTFANEISLSDVLSRGGGLTLVDHNELAIHQQALGAHVVRIVDHHSDSGEYSKANRLIARTGSCASLVSESIRDDAHILPPIAYMLLVAVLIDTNALERRTLPQDVAAAARLGRIADLPKSRWNKLLKRISKAREDVSGFSTRDMLFKDYKCFSGRRGLVGISSVGEGLVEWTMEESRKLDMTTIESVRCEKNVECMMVMTNLKRDDVFCREVGIFGDTDVAR